MGTKSLLLLRYILQYEIKGLLLLSEKRKKADDEEQMFDRNVHAGVLECCRTKQHEDGDS
jgi:hypothetical protein